MSKLRLRYYVMVGCVLEGYEFKFNRESLKEMKEYGYDFFFRSDKIKTIEENYKKDHAFVSRKYTWTAEIEEGKKYKFKLGSLFTIVGLATRYVDFAGSEFLEVEIVPGKLYLYTLVVNGFIDHLKVLGEIVEN